MSPPRGGDSWKWSETENQSKPLASANFHSLRISPSGPPMWPMWIPKFMSLSRAAGSTTRNGTLPWVPKGGTMPDRPYRVYVIQGRGQRDYADCQVALAHV